MDNERNNEPHTIPDTAEDQSHHMYEPGAIEDDSFSYDGFQVVRSEYFAHTYEPSITFNDYKVYVNKACTNRLSDIDYVKILVSRNEKKLAIEPCDESEKGSFMWRSKGKDGRNPRQLSCRVFFAMIMSMMDWNPSYRYKLLGKLIVNKGSYLFVFDLTEPEIYQRLLRDPVTGNVIKPGSNKPMYPEEWKNQFGLPVEENRKSLQINIFNGYAVYSIKEKKESVMISDTPHEGERSEKQ